MGSGPNHWKCGPDPIFIIRYHGPALTCRRVADQIAKKLAAVDLQSMTATTTRLPRCRALAPTLLLFVCSLGAASEYPSRPIRLVAPFPAGGTADVVARTITNEAGAQMGQPFVLDNRAGANGIIGTDTVAKAMPDGYTLLHVTASFVINPHIYRKLPYD